jgi:Ran GTPase-activating protein (RanGAP) involved in mRNA processing and transport
VYQNGSKSGLIYLLEALVYCKDTIREVNISDNKSINRAIPQLVDFIKKCTKLEQLNISDLKMKKKNCKLVADAIVESQNNSSSLKQLTWNFDLAVSNSTAKDFLNKLYECPKLTLELLELSGVFLV